MSSPGRNSSLPLYVYNPPLLPPPAVSFPSTTSWRSDTLLSLIMHSASRQWQPIWQCSLSPFRIFVTRVYTRASTYNHLYEDKTGRSHTVHVNGLLLIISVWTGWNVKMGVCWHRHFHTITFIAGIFIYMYIFFFIVIHHLSCAMES